jgi:hypothetical protein
MHTLNAPHFTTYSYVRLQGTLMGELFWICWVHTMLKGTISRDFCFWFFSWIIFPLTLENSNWVISNLFRNFGDIPKTICTTSINLPPFLLVSLILAQIMGTISNCLHLNSNHGGYLKVPWVATTRLNYLLKGSWSSPRGLYILRRSQRTLDVMFEGTVTHNILLVDYRRLVIKTAGASINIIPCG